MQYTSVLVIYKRTRKCSECGVVKRLDQYHKNGKGGLRANCKDCANSHRRKYLLEPDNIERNREYNRQYYSDNKRNICLNKSVYRRTPEGKEVTRRSNSSPRAVAQIMARRRSIQVPDTETAEHIIWCREQTCVYCRGPGGTHDHIIPISREGTNHWSNIVPACGKCNGSKGTKNLIQWLLSR